MNQYFFTFIFGGALTTIIVYCEVNGFPLLSRIATLFPVFTWLSYLYIGTLADSSHIAQHALFVLLGTLISWVPYMLFIYFFAEKLGAAKTISCAILIFFFLATIFSISYKHFS